MGAAFFYHLTRQPLDHTLAVLLDKARGAGWRIAVRGTDAGRMEWLDEKLWQGPDDGFLAHGLAGGPHDALQPVLLTVRPAAAGRDAIMTVDGAEVTPAEVGSVQRVWILFDGRDDRAVARARDQWKALTGGGVSAQYWSEESGRWEKKAER